MTSILAIDPGSSQSAWLQFDGTRPGGFGITANDVLVRALRTGGLPDVVVIEKVESYGMAVGAEVFDTVLWAGRFAEAAHRVPVVLLPRRAVKLALCGDSRAKDANIRQALIDRFGGSAAVGRKAAPGPLYGISRDVWSALAIAVTYTHPGRVRVSGRGEQDEHVAGSPVLSARVAEETENRRRCSPCSPRSSTAADTGHPANVVILALVAALLDLEQRRNRGKVRPPMDRDRSA